MKRILALLIVSLFLAQHISAQSLINKIPQDAALVGVIKGANLLALVPEKELMQYHFIEDLFKVDPKGIDLSSDAYIFISMTDSIAYNCVLYTMSSEEKLIQMLNAHARNKIEKIGAFNGIIGKDQITLWDNKNVLVAIPFGMKKPKRYGYNWYEEDVTEVAVEEEVDAKEATEVEPDGILLEEIEEMVESPRTVDPYQIKQQKKEARFEKDMLIFREKQNVLLRKFAIDILSKNTKLQSIAMNSSYLKSRNSKAVASFWTNRYGDIYSKALGLNDISKIGTIGMTNYLGMISKLSSPEANGVKSIVVDMIMKNDHAELVAKTVMTDKMAQYYKSIGKRRMNKDFFKYFNGDNVLGYTGFAFNTENAIDVYPKMMNNIFRTAIPEMQEEVAIGTELLSILLDGEEIGELIKGDALFVISDVIEKELKYTSYEYDEDFNSKKVEKTRMEPMPEFILMASTDKTDFFKRLFSLGKKYRLIHSDQGDIFKLEVPRNPIEVYFVLHNDIFFMTSSEYQARDIAAGKTGATSRKHRKFARKNSTVLYVNNDKVLNAIPKGAFPRDAMPSLNYFQSNFKTGEITVSRIKRNTVTTSMKINTTGKQENALKAFFELFEQISNPQN